MAKQKLGMGTIEINKKLKDYETAYRYARNLQAFINYTCKKNENKGYEAQAIIGVSNINGQAVVGEINKRDKKRGRPMKEKQFVSEDSYYGKTKHTNWHIHILIVSKPSYTFRNLIKNYIDKNWVDIEKLYDVKEFDLSKLDKIKNLGGQAYKKTTNIGTLFYIGKQSIKPLYCNYPKNNGLKYSLKQLYNEKVKLDTELLNNKDYRHNVDRVKEQVEKKYLEILDYYYSITKEQDKKKQDKFNKKEHKQTIINIANDKLELKVNDVDMFNTFDYWRDKSGELIETKIFYGINSKFEPLTFLNASVTNSSYKAIPHSIISSDMYILGKQATNPIKHFEEHTKIRSFNYYNEDLLNIFGSSSVTIKHNFKTRELNVKAMKQKDKLVCKIKTDIYNMSVYLVNSYKDNGNAFGIKIEPFTYLKINVSKSIDLAELIKINNRLDSVIHLFVLSQKRNKVLDIFGTQKDLYIFYNLKINNEDKKKSNFYLGENKDRIINFTKLLELLISVSNDNSNSFFPFLNYDRSTSSQEILFLEYYRVLEYMNILSQKKKGRDKNNTFLIPLLKKYSDVKTRYLPNDTE